MISYAWYEELPPQCPPQDAEEPKNLDVYRLVENYPPTDIDFCSLRFIYPEKPFHASECTAHALSVYVSARDCTELKKLPRHKSKEVVKLILTPESGKILSTGKKESHRSWWRAAMYDPINAAIKV